MKRRTKIPFSLIAELGYYKFKKMNVNGISGYMYWLDKKLTKEQKEELKNKYGNIEFFISKCEYAPEIKNDVIFEGCKCFKF